MTVIIVLPIGLIAPDASLDNLLQGIETDGAKIAFVLFGVIIAISSIITLVGRRYGIQVSADRISGRSESGDLVEFPTATVDKVWRIPNQYAPRLVISSSASTEQISTVIFGLDYKKLRQELPVCLGQDHPLSTFFSAK